MDAMNAIKNKIRSRTGASISFALLIFLVCAVISSIVIVAASAASGRLSTVREMDQRYYAATSAAEALRDAFDGKSVTLEYSTSDSGAVTVSRVIPNATGFLLNASKSIVDASVPVLSTTKTREVSGITYTCTVNGTLSGGLLTFDIAVNGGKLSKGTYTLRVIFSSNVKTADVTDTDAVTGRARISWKLNSIRKVVNKG